MSGSNSPPVFLTRALVLVHTFAQRVVQVLLTGFVIILPFVILGLLIGMTLDFTRSLLQPIIVILRWSGIIRTANFGVLGDILIELGFYSDTLGFFAEIVAILLLLGVVITLGVFASFRSGKQTMDYVDAGVATIPGIGPIYESFRRVGNLLIEDGLEEFQSVKLVEFPHRGCYSLAFETNQAPESIRTITEDDDMMALFVPLAPNPLMGGFLIHVSQERVLDVDMTVKEAARAIITSGFAAGEDNFETKPSLNPFDG